MILPVHAAEVLAVHVRVDLGRRDVGVAEHLLDRAKVGAEVAVSNLSSAPVGAKTIRDSKPDGRTVGILHGGEIMIRHLLEGAGAADVSSTSEAAGADVADADSGRVRHLDDETLHPSTVRRNVDPARPERR